MTSTDDRMILVEHGPGGAPAMFAAPRAVVVAAAPDEVPAALAQLDAARDAGRWVAGWIAYEAGAAFEPRLAQAMRRGPGPALVMGVFDGPADAGPWLSAPAAPVAISPPRPLIGAEDHAAAMARLLAYIAAGDCYQVNLTFPLESRLVAGTPADLYRALRAGGNAGGHGAFADLGAGPALVSASPELFFATGADGALTARPMKGTAPRDPDPARDAALAAGLRASVKDRAENLMIVDLLRNDISRLAQIGSVRVPGLYEIESWPTVHQMTSTVTGRLAAAPRLSTLIPALFPCGSVTGAPKIRAMEIIAELETGPRGPYCGAIGWMAPDGASDFSVAIRTLAIAGDRVTLNVGGGIVADSTAAGEWEEALWKTRFLQGLTSPD